MHTSKPTTKTYRIKMHEVQMMVLYRIVLQRIAHHFSQEEVSFLMGKPSDFMTDVETLKIKNILAIDLYIFKEVLEIKSFGALFPHMQKPSIDKIQHRYRIITYPDRVIYHMEKVNSTDNTYATIFFLLDSNYALEPFPESAKEEQTKLRDAINTLFDSGYFKSERTPYEIYRKCYATVKESVRPKDIMRILAEITGRSGYPKLERFECKEMGYVYSRVDEPTIESHEK